MLTTKKKNARGAITNLIKWVFGKTWKERWDYYCFETLTEISRRLGLSKDEFADRTDKIEGFDPTIFGALFEHFLEIEFESPPHSAVEDYLQRRGWRESKWDQEYLREMKSVPFSIYEVIDVKPGTSVTVQDLIRPFPPVEVKEVSGSQCMQIMDHLKAKVVKVLGEYYFTGSTLKLTPPSAEKRIKEIQKTVKNLGLSLDKRNFREEENLAQINQLLHSNALNFITDGIGYILSPGALLVNVEGHHIVFADILFPVKNRERIIQLLDKHKEFNQLATQADETPFWDWFLLKKPPSTQVVTEDNNTLCFKTVNEDLTSIRGTLELTKQGLKCSVNSKERAEILIPKLEDLLKDAVGKPIITYQSIESLQEQNKPGKQKAKKDKKLDISPEEEQEIIREFLDNHYRGTLDMPLPMLKNKSPREAVKTKEGKANVVKWLRYLETGNQRTNYSSYDFSWMWEELGISDLKT